MLYKDFDTDGNQNNTAQQFCFFLKSIAELMTNPNTNYGN